MKRLLLLSALTVSLGCGQATKQVDFSPPDQPKTPVLKQITVTDENGPRTVTVLEGGNPVPYLPPAKVSPPTKMPVRQEP